MRAAQAAAQTARRIGRYYLFDEIASGGMASVRLGRLVGSAGFARMLAVKCLHAHFAKDPDFVSMFKDEARLAARIRHPNVAATHDVISEGDELFLVMEYIHGESLATLLRAVTKQGGRVPVPIAVAIGLGALAGLHAAHEATDEAGRPLDVVHRDISPQNIMVGVDGAARVLDFGVAKAVGRLQTTREGEIKGKTAYMAPEQLSGRPVDRRADVYGMAVVLWETLASHRLFIANTPSEVLMQVLTATVKPPSAYAPDVPPELDAIVLRGLSRDPAERFPTALAMAVALEQAILPPTAREVGAWVERAAGEELAKRSARVKHIELHGAEVVEEEGGGGPADVTDIRAIGQPPAGGSDFLPSQVMSVSTTVESPPRSRRALFVLPVLIAGISAFAVHSFSDRTKRAENTANAERAASPPSATETAAPLTSSAVPKAAPPVAPPVAPPAASSSADSLSSAAASASRLKPARNVSPKPRATSKPAARPTPNCDPPYIVDPDGIHIQKPECG
jgi:serine/threonine-protein kinase